MWARKSVCTEQGPKLSGHLEIARSSSTQVTKLHAFGCSTHSSDFDPKLSLRHKVVHGCKGADCCQTHGPNRTQILQLCTHARPPRRLHSYLDCSSVDGSCKQGTHIIRLTLGMRMGRWDWATRTAAAEPWMWRT